LCSVAAAQPASEGGVVSALLKRTPLHDEHEARGARFVEYAGYRMPVQYAGVSAEHHAVRQAAGLFDVSHMGRLVLSGAEALETANGLITNDLSAVAVGRAVYTCCCNEAGGVVDDLIVYRLAAERVLVVCNAANHTVIAEKFRLHTAERCKLSDITTDTCLLAVQGPCALQLVSGLAREVDVAGLLPAFHVAEVSLCGEPCTVARTGYTGEDGVEIVCAPAHALTLWRRLLEAGAQQGVMPVGLAARDTLRLEARLALYGNELDLNTTPFEAGLGWTVKLGKREFIGQQALRAAKAQPPRRALVGFEMTGRGIARHGYPINDREGQAVGVCTSGAPSPTLGKNIGLGYVAPEYAAVGTELSVDCRGRAVGARVVKTPFYRRQQ
jgi:aminomethyltransferase